MFKVKKTKSGLSIISAPIKGINTVTVMVLLKVGSKNESSPIWGISHMIEHLVFKGTLKRPNTKVLSEELDKIGGEYNAFTSKEYTGYYVKVGSKNIELALDWLSDLIINPQFDKNEIDKERGVIIEEINMRADTPIQYIEDVWEESLWENQPLGREIAGTKDTVKKISRRSIVNYKNKYYSPKNCVVCVAGKFSPGVTKKAEKYFDPLSGENKSSAKKIKENQTKPKIQSQYKKTDQVHCIVGFKTCKLSNKDRYALNLINSIMGGGMSSRFFTEVREKRGLAYYVCSDSQLYLDAGYFSCQTGLDNSKLKEALAVILAEYKKITEKDVGKEELRKAKEYLKGHSQISMEASNNQALFYASQQLLKNRIETLAERFKIIDGIDQDHLKKIAKKYFVRRNLNLAMIGPQRKSAAIERILNNF